MTTLMQPRWVYNDGSAVTYDMSIAQRPWGFGSRGEGGSDVAASGVPAAFEIRRDQLMHLTMRFPESEWADVERLVRHLQGAGSAIFLPNRARIEQSTAGIWTGATDFSEFAVASGVPPGITQFGLGSDAPVTMAVANDATEGNYFSMAAHGVQGWAFGLDAFAGLMQFGELLARVYVNTGSVNARTGLGPVMSLSGLVAEPEASPDLSFSGGGLYRRAVADYESQVWKTTNGSGGIPVDDDLQEAEQDQVWAWMRVRRTANSGDSDKDDGQMTTWYGALGDEPGSPDATYSAGGTTNIRGLGALGWGVQQFGSTAEQRISFLSFSSDATASPPPTTADAALTVYGDEPKMGSEIRPRRSAEPSTLEIDITVRRSTDSVITDQYYL